MIDGDAAVPKVGNRALDGLGNRGVLHGLRMHEDAQRSVPQMRLVAEVDR